VQGRISGDSIKREELQKGAKSVLVKKVIGTIKKKEPP
jgi:hypothetical protein